MGIKRLLKPEYLVLLLFAVTLAIRLYFAFKSQYFDYDSYFDLRQIEHISQTGLPIFSDALSYGGKLVLFSPFFHYLIAFFTLFMPVSLAAKIVPNVLISLIVPIVYLISMEITKNKNAALITTAFAMFIPALSTTIYSVKNTALMLPLIFFTYYCLIRIDKKLYLNLFLVFTLLSALTSPLSIILIFAFWLHLLILKIEQAKEKRTAFEAVIFSSFLILLIQFMIYKKAILMHGFSALMQNVPKELLSSYFSQITIIDAIAMMGLVPFILGLYEIYNFSTARKEYHVGAIISFVVCTAFLLFFKLLELNVGIMFLGVGLTIISCVSFKTFFNYLQKTHFSDFAKYAAIVILFLFLLTSVKSSIFGLGTNEGVSENQFSALEWIKENVNANATFASGVEEGYLITAIAGKKNIMDKNFLMEEDVETKYADLKTIFTTKYETTAIELLQKYKADYIFLSPNTKNEFKIDNLLYINERCFDLVYDKVVQVYKVRCGLE